MTVMLSDDRIASSSRALLLFEQHRALLFSIAYRMLGQAADAEDAVQETFLRWQGVDHAEIVEPRAWLIAACTRLCIDELRSARRKREHYVGPWLPEPLVEDCEPVDARLEREQEVNLAFLLLLERLGPVERAAYLLHEVFDLPHQEIAQLLDRSAVAVRQVVSRARRRLQIERALPPIERERRERLTASFFAALASGDPAELARTLAKDARLHSDGGGKVLAALNVIVGADRVSRFLAGVLAKQPKGLTPLPVRVNGETGLALLLRGRVHGIMALDLDAAGAVAQVFILRNPDKLRRAERWLGHSAAAAALPASRMDRERPASQDSAR